MVRLPFATGSGHVLRDGLGGFLYLLDLLVWLLFLLWLRIVNHLLLNLLLLSLLISGDMRRILIPTLLLEHRVIFLVLVVDRDDLQLGSFVWTPTVSVCYDLLFGAVFEHCLLVLVRVGRDQTTDLLLLMQDLTERVLMVLPIGPSSTAWGIRASASALLVLGWVVGVAQLKKLVAHSSLPVIFRLLGLVIDNGLPDLINVVVTVTLGHPCLGTKIL